ncbi:MAG: type 4a pilus biogenesis protein PilO [Candidatus Omnitrophica bacterium]|nr:type 4a pilus biogenesis protein PilO [Candidatus Omnitrophota bacterium]MDD5310327.1 type 4a pilus biogenesis protein PilO [Candidatus Omnitrophota bacterium]MDD5545872.1 type 4a pilus biogenesis protein PilO [Candidatus Omnitrophota bacterium]
MTLLNLSGRESKLFYLTLAVIVAWAAQAFILKPVSTKWKRLNDEIAADTLKLEKSERLIGRTGPITGDYEKAASALRMAGSAEEEMAKFLTEIESLANTTGVHINEIKPLPTKKFSLYRKFYAGLELEGDMIQISDFMRKVQNSAHLLAIDRLSLNPKQARSNILRCGIVISKIAIH